jgi:hypothetical protein
MMAGPRQETLNRWPSTDPDDLSQRITVILTSAASVRTSRHVSIAANPPLEPPTRSGDGCFHFYLERIMHFLNVGDLSRVFRTKAKHDQRNHSL